MAKSKIVVEEKEISVTSAGVTFSSISDRSALDNLKKIEIVDTALEAAKSFAKNFKTSFIPCGNKEIDDYIKNIFDESDDTTLSISDFEDQLLNYIIPGCAGSRVIWAKDETGLQFPKLSYGFDKSYIFIDEQGEMLESTSGDQMKIDPYRIYIIRDVLDIINAYGKGKQTVITDLLKHISDFYKNISVTGKKYKNPGKVIDIKSVNDDTKNKTNVDTVGGNAKKLDYGSALVTTGLEKFHVMPTGKVTELLEVLDGLERKIVRAIVGHPEALEGFKFGNGTKMESIIKIVMNTAKTRNRKVLFKKNALARNIVDVRFGTTFPAPIQTSNYDDETDQEALQAWYEKGLKVKKSKVYNKIGGEPTDDDFIQKPMLPEPKKENGDK